MPPLHSQPPSYQQRASFTYPLLGPVLSNVGNPNGQLSLVNGMSHHGMPMHYNSGHAAMQQLYGHPMPQHNPQTDRPFRCDQCPQSFNRNHDLKRHKRIHLAVKPFPCGHCDKSFSRKDALKVRFKPADMLPIRATMLTSITASRSCQRLRQSTCDRRSERDRWFQLARHEERPRPQPGCHKSALRLGTLHWTVFPFLHYRLKTGTCPAVIFHAHAILRVYMDRYPLLCFPRAWLYRFFGGSLFLTRVPAYLHIAAKPPPPVYLQRHFFLDIMRLYYFFLVVF
jgi:hypothetical protein